MPDWRLPGPPDRRRLPVGWHAAAGAAATASLRPPLDPATAPHIGVPVSSPALQVVGLYSDLRHHDLGPAFHQRQFDGSVVRRFRTPPLWGVGTSAPYGHDGASLDLDAVIRRHGGEAAEAAARYRALPTDEREEMLGFLRALVLEPVVIPPQPSPVRGVPATTTPPP